MTLTWGISQLLASFKTQIKVLKGTSGDEKNHLASTALQVASSYCGNETLLSNSNNIF